jgi:hypothetical protein
VSEAADQTANHQPSPTTEPPATAATRSTPLPITPAPARTASIVPGSANDPAKHRYPCFVPDCDEKAHRNMNRPTDINEHMRRVHRIPLPKTIGGPANKVDYNNDLRKRVRDWADERGVSCAGSIFARDAADD